MGSKSRTRLSDKEHHSIPLNLVALINRMISNTFL